MYFSLRYDNFYVAYFIYHKERYIKHVIWKLPRLKSQFTKREKCMKHEIDKFFFTTKDTSQFGQAFPKSLLMYPNHLHLQLHTLQINQQYYIWQCNITCERENTTATLARNERVNYLKKIYINASIQYNVTSMREFWEFWTGNDQLMMYVCMYVMCMYVQKLGMN